MIFLAQHTLGSIERTLGWKSRIWILFLSLILGQVNFRKLYPLSSLLYDKLLLAVCPQGCRILEIFSILHVPQFSSFKTGIK